GPIGRYVSIRLCPKVYGLKRNSIYISMAIEEATVSEIEIAGSSALVQLVITFDPSTGGVNVQGPIQNPIMAFGLLEVAKLCIQQANKQEERRVVPATFAGLPRS